MASLGAEANSVDLFFRHVFEERLRTFVPAGAPLLALGRARLGLDPSRPVVRVEEPEGLEGLAGDFGGACTAGLGALDGWDLRTLDRALAAALPSGAPLLLGVSGPWPLPAMLERGLTGVGTPRRDRGRWPSPRAVRAALGRTFRWRGSFALGVLLPGAGHAAWAERNPQAFGLLAALERIVRRWPLFRILGDFVVLEGERR